MCTAAWTDALHWQVRQPVITLGGYKHSISHPIHDADFGHPGIMAELVLPFVELNRQLLRAPTDGAAGAPQHAMLHSHVFKKIPFKKVPATCSIVSEGGGPALM